MSKRPLALMYVHGFQSSAQSHKASLTGEYLARHHSDIAYSVPNLSDYPEQAFRQLCEVIESRQGGGYRLGLLGSSLGGFYATALAAKYGLSAVLINPAVAPHRLIADYLGDNTNPYTGQRYTLGEADLQCLKALQLSEAALAQALGAGQLRLRVLLETGDETLDYRQAERYYAAADCRIRKGGSHTYEAYESELVEILKFFH